MSNTNPSPSPSSSQAKGKRKRDDDDYEEEQMKEAKADEDIYQKPQSKFIHFIHITFPFKIIHVQVSNYVSLPFM